MTQPTAIIAIHGGAGTIARGSITAEQECAYLEALHTVLRSGQDMLANGACALDVVTEAVRLFEDCPLFNAGKGAVFTDAGTHELDAAIMDGKTLATGAVASVRRIANPVLAARAVMEHSGHVLMVGQAAEEFANSRGLKLVEPEYFYTAFRYEQWQRARAEAKSLLDHDAAHLVAGSQSANDGAPLDSEKKFGTVGAVALDAEGNLAAAGSTGGMTNKRAGRVGDTPLIGAGCYANNHTVAVASTGMGEMFIRMVAAYDVSAQMEYGDRSLRQAVEYTVMRKLPQINGQGGMVAVDYRGNVALSFNTEGMYRGFARVGEEPLAAIYGDPQGTATEVTEAPFHFRR